MKTKEIKELTTAEEQVMQAIWSIKQGFANEIVAAISSRPNVNDDDPSAIEPPKPAYNTILTVVRILEKKGFVGHTTFNKSNRYYPLISRDDYSSQILGRMARNYFGSSFRNMVSFLVDRKDVSIEDLDALIKEVEK
ncbi:MAG: BlaI/MecI/CopY family transcriptional regulator [Bacteroidales bacterium]|nr:BlaI/MecI/CopY family transcriptional regulator [Bacteroidales bacterium]